MSEAIDRLVAERVMGWKLADRVKCGWGKGPPVYRTNCPENPTHQDPCFTTNISDAWEVIKELRSRRSPHDEPTDPTWTVNLTGSGDRWIVNVVDWKGRVDVSACNESECVAICLAALRAVGVSEAEIQKATSAE